MTVETIIQEASQNKSMNGYSLLDMHLYLVIQQILKMYFNNQISKEQANQLKKQAIKKYNDRYKEFEFEESMFQEHVENIKKTENLRIRLRKQLNSNTEINEVLNTCIELIELYSGEEFG